MVTAGAGETVVESSTDVAGKMQLDTMSAIATGAVRIATIRARGRRTRLCFDDVGPANDFPHTRMLVTVPGDAEMASRTSFRFARPADRGRVVATRGEQGPPENDTQMEER